MTAVIEHVEGHYETHVMPYGRAYIWCPECVVLTASEGECGCGADHRALVREVTASHGKRGGAQHPWDREYREWQDEFLRSEKPYQQELGAVD
jgi:hypothetical protein